MATGAAVQQIRVVIKSWVAAIHNKDVQAIALNHSAGMVMFDVVKPMQYEGLREYRKAWELFSRYSKGGKDSFQLKELAIHAGDEVAFCTALIQLSKRKNPECRLTLGLKKIRGKWMIVHEHHSAPHSLA